MFRELFVNFCILTTLTLLGCMAVTIAPELPRTWSRRLQHWVALWLGTYILMQFPVVLTGGVMLAFYAVPAGLAGLFGGLSWGAAVAIPVALYRASLGGAGAMPGVVHVLVVGLIAGALSPGTAAWRVSPLQIAWRALLTFMVGNLSMLLVPGMGFAIFRTYYPIIMPVSAAALLLCVSLVKMQVKSSADLSSANTMARLDALTGLPNHRSLMEALDSREPGDFDCFLMLDIDHFKEVNDTYGHLCGDEVLRRSAEVLQREVRSSDLLCRYGGEEFAVLMRSCTLARARDVAERLRSALAETVHTVGEETILLTLSAGLVALDADQPFAGQFALADLLLYEAKTLGRNRVISQGDRPADA